MTHSVEIGCRLKRFYLGRLEKMIHAFIWFCLCFSPLVGMLVAEANEVKAVPVMAGDSVTLESNITDIQGYDQIEWRYGNIRIVRIKEVNGVFSTTYIEDWRFIGRLQLDNHTGSLTITNLSLEHSELYEQSIKVGNKKHVTIYNLTVYAPLSIPVISSYCTQTPSSRCSLLCSVLNVSHVTLSWFKGNSLLSSISVSELSISLSLPLEVEYQDKNTYSCVLNNPIRNQTRHISDLDWLSSSCNLCFDTTEAVIRLVVTALMGVAAVVAIVVLVYDIRSRTGVERRNIHTRH
ncbi:CD48 antigen-like [Pseudorasbora parva]|uniref:CD48 antigen-like n=1 Tax=Pseudorasbora parva TaxID=51549 RepID=UPI00351F0EC6